MRSLLTVLFLALAALATRADDWKFAAPGHDFTFPRDHAAHHDYRIEWWYWTGNLETAEGRRFGFQLTFFRTGADREPANPSAFAIRDLYLAHVAVSDIDEESFHHAQQLHRAGVGRAGDRFDPTTGTTTVWNDRWYATITDDAQHLVAHDPVADIAIDLHLTPLKPPVLNGDRGYSQKGSDPDNASLYYALTRMQTTGTVTVGDTAHTVTGLTWMDREFGSSFLEEGQQGWDWFSLQFDDGRDLMIYQLRRDDGTADPYSAGTLTAGDGTTTHLKAGDFTLTPQSTWTSPATGADYPVAWRVTVPEQDLDLTVRATFPAQEFTADPTKIGAPISYWEGAVDVTGSATGRGYLEMTGYHGQALTRALTR